tara:strand:+ start:96 stop:1253 length:1158 start_codon:yes stop_codon:yes gene_type:complete
MSATKFIPIYNSKNEKHKKRGFITWNLGLVARASLIVLIAYLLFWATALITHITHSVSFDNYHLAMSVMILSPLLALSSIFNNYILASGYPSLASFMNAISYYLIKLFVLFLGFYVFLPNTNPNLSAIFFSYLFLLMATSALTYGFLPGSELIPSLISYKTNKKTKRASLVYINAEWLEVSQGCVINNLFAMISATAGIYILEIFSPSEHYVGLYNICMVAVGFVSVLATSMNKITNPLVAKIGHVTGPEAKETLNYLGALNIIRPLMFFSSMVIYYLSSESIFAFFNLKDHSHGILLPLMLFSALIDNSSQLRSVFLLSHGKEAYCAITRIIKVIMLVVCGCYLTIHYDIYGIVIANILSRLVRLIILSYEVRRITNIRFNYFF